ncbi:MULTISPECIES: DNA polymerase III subunit alpha [unclassified Streptococcus]|uniref:DNA polymerase III subunit alpha n=1 Tax=unclassified Streptococcus TaxID=2608887 RepID=UPI001071CFB6|nr:MULTISPECIES: DNA polymerase III subunit alpha [unclassified Streptococcus]TFU29132.1 DNA polymerase III subunit alpha [Streptococcus sp. WM07]
MIQLNTRSVYSFLESNLTLNSYVQRARDLGYQSLGLMDQDNLYGAYAFLEIAEKAGIQALLGMSLTTRVGEQMIELQLLARSTKGYQNLLKLATQRNLGKVAWEELLEYTEDLAVIRPYQPGQEELDLDIPYFLGLGLESPRPESDLPLLPFPTIRYLESQDLEVLQVMEAIKANQSLIETPVRYRGQGLLPAQEVKEAYQTRFPGAWENLEKLVDGIHYDLDRSLKLPRFNPQRPAVEELRERARAGLEAKGLLGIEYLQRLDEELTVIHEMGFDDYFLIVWDLLAFGRRQGYYMGMGRGSAVGSLVAYALDITGIDPVAKNLIFERFLNRERFSMPDIDIDIPDIHRPDFLRYVRDRYGSMHAAQIVTFSTFGAKQALRDVLKRIGLPEFEISGLTKQIRFGEHLRQVAERSLSFRRQFQERPELGRALQLAMRLEGLPRQTSVHAAGVVMSDADLTDFIPLKYAEDIYITQYDAAAIEDNGLLKMDFLGLRNLTYVERMRDLLLKEEGVVLEPARIPLEDPDTLALFAAGRTKGIFQFEQPGAIHLLRRVQPQSFEEVVATTSLNRPGASDYIDNFVARKHGREAVASVDPAVADILAPTYGIMLYQEQVMQVAQRFAGFSLGKADLLRRAMGKKRPEEMHAMEADFVEGALQQGYDQERAKALFAIMEKFAGYGFNRSHAYAYSALAFQLAYFKTHYPHIFFQVLLSSGNQAYLEDALDAGFQMQSLTINSVSRKDRFQNGAIYLGLNRIKGLPRDFQNWILEQQPFADLEDFFLRLPSNYQKVEFLKPLIQIGLFDQMAPNRATLLTNLDRLLFFYQELGSLFADSSYSWEEVADFSSLEKYRMEVELLGVGLSPHPLKDYLQDAGDRVGRIADLQVGRNVELLVELLNMRVIRTKKGEQMSFIQVTDTRHKIEVIVFPETFRKFKDFLQEGHLLRIRGKVQDKDGRKQILLNHAELLTKEQCWILLQNHQLDQEVARILKAHPGPVPVILRYQEGKETLQLEGGVSKSEQLVNALGPYALKTVFLEKR